MRVAFFLGKFPVVSETFVLSQITGLIDLGHEVDIFSAHRPFCGEPDHPDVDRYDLLSKTTYFEDLIPAASGVWEMPVWPVSGETWLPGAEEAVPNSKRVREAVPHLIRCLQQAPEITFEVLDSKVYGEQALSLSALYRLSAILLKSNKYDVLHAHFGPVANSFRFIKHLFKVPLIVSFHGYDCSVIPKQAGLDVYRGLFADVDIVTVNSQHMHERIVELGCPAQKLYHLKYGLNLQAISFRERLCQPNQPVRLLTIGRLVEKKGIEYSIRAFSKVKIRYPSMQYDIIGEGPLRPSLETLIAELGLTGQVILHGAQNGDYVRQMMNQSDLFILASVIAEDGDKEGTPVSLLEAQASGLPVLSTLHSGIPEIVQDKVSGLLVPERDMEALADAINYFLENPDRWRDFGLQGRKYMEAHYDIQKLNCELQALYERAINAACA